MTDMMKAIQGLQNEFKHIRNENDRLNRSKALASSIMQQAYRRLTKRKEKNKLSEGDIYGMTYFVQNGDISEIGAEKLLALAEDLYDNGETDDPKIMKLVITIIETLS